MQIKNERLAVLPVDALYGPGGVNHRQKPEISSPTQRPVKASKSDGGHRNFEDFTAGRQLDVLKKSWKFWVTVQIVADGENARVIEEAFLGENLPGPQVAAKNRKSWRTIPDHTNTCGVLNSAASPAQIIAKLFGLQRENSAMGVTVAGKLVASVSNLANKGRIALGDPPKHKESSAPIVVGEKLNDPFAISVHPRSKTRPIFRAHVVRKGFHVKIVLDIDAQSVRYDSGSLANSSAEWGLLDWNSCNRHISSNLDSTRKTRRATRLPAQPRRFSVCGRMV